MRSTPLVSLALSALAVAACAGTSGASPSATVAPTATPSAAPSAATSAASVRIEVSLTDAMTIEPDPMTVPAGLPVTFVVTNTGRIAHELTLGDEEAQEHHEQEMAEQGATAMAHDEDNTILVEPGATKELVFTFDEPGSSLAGCHVPGHYAAGMRALITVE